MSAQDDIITEFAEMAAAGQALAKRFSLEPYRAYAAALKTAIQQLDAASSGSWIGYQSCFYIEDFEPRTADDFFDLLSGPGAMFSRMHGNWFRYERESVKDLLYSKVLGPDGRQQLDELARDAYDCFLDTKSSMTALLDALLFQYKDQPLKKLREEVEDLPPFLSASDFIRMQAPRTYMSRDHEAMAQGVAIPPHKEVEAWLMQNQSYAIQLAQLARLAGRGAKYVERKTQLSAAGIMSQLKDTFMPSRAKQGDRKIRAGKGANIFTGDMPHATIQQANNAFPGGDISLAAGNAQISPKRNEDDLTITQEQFNSEITAILHSLTDAKEALESDQATLVQFFASILGLDVQGKNVAQIKAEVAQRLSGSTALPALQRLSSHTTPITQGIVSSIIYSSIIQPAIAALSSLA